MIFDTSSAEVLDLHLQKYTWFSLVKQMAFGILGFLFALFAYRQGVEWLIRVSPYLLLLFSLFLVLTLIPGIGREINGSKRWIALGPLSFQPSEFVKFILPAFFIHYLMDKPLTFTSFLTCLGYISVPLFLILIEPNNGTVAVMVVSLIVVAFLGRIPFKWWGIPLICISLAGVLSVMTLPYAQGRIQTWLHPELDLKGKGHQPYQAKIATGSGGLFGKGTGKSLQKLSYLPEATNDYIAAIFAEEYGFVGVLLLIGAYMSFTLAGIFLTLTHKETKPFLMAASIVFLISFQAFLNLGVVSGLLPSTGLTLPFFSQGGTSLIANTTFMGFLWKKSF